MARLITEDWDQMTRAANASANHVRSLDRWIRQAREANPALSDDQAERLAILLRRQHYVRMGQLSARARKLARETQAELDRGGEAPGRPLRGRRAAAAVPVLDDGATGGTEGRARAASARPGASSCSAAPT